MPILSRYTTAIILLVVTPFASAIEGTRPAYTPPPPAVSSGSIVQIMVSLLLVLAAIVLVALALKRMNGKQGSGDQFKVLSGIAIGQRERVVLVEIKDTWLVVGVGPGQIRTLLTMQKPEDSEPDDGSPNLQPAENKNKFAAALSAALNSISSGKRDAP